MRECPSALSGLGPGFDIGGQRRPTGICERRLVPIRRVRFPGSRTAAVNPTWQREVGTARCHSGPSSAPTAGHFRGSRLAIFPSGSSPAGAPARPAPFDRDPWPERLAASRARPAIRRRVAATHAAYPPRSLAARVHDACGLGQIVGMCARVASWASSTSRAKRSAVINSEAVMVLMVEIGWPSRRRLAWTTHRISTSTAGSRSMEMAPAQLGAKSAA